MRANPDNIRVLEIVKGMDIGNLHGGAERFALELACELKEKGLSIAVCSFFQVGTRAEEKWQAKLSEVGIPYFFAAPWAGNNNFRMYKVGLQRLINILHSSPIDICHTHFQLATIGAILLKAMKLSQYSVRTCHVTQEWEAGWYGWGREQIFSKWIFPLFVDAEVGVSAQITRKLRSNPGARLRPGHALHIKNAIPEASMNNSLSIDKPVQVRNQTIIGTVGRLSEVKGQRYLIEAGSIIRQTIPDIEIWLIGDGELKRELQAAAESLKMQNQVRFFGQRDDVPELISQFDLFVLPSLREGMPTVILESFAQGVPVVATNVSGSRELIQPGITGWLAKPADPESLAHEVLRALQNPTALEKAAKAGRLAVEEYRIEKIAEQYQELFYQLLLKGQNPT